MMVAGPSVARRIELAVDIGKRHRHWETAVVELADIIGSGLHVSEAVPAAFGLFACCPNSAVDAIISGVNIGNDTDTVRHHGRGDFRRIPWAWRLFPPII
ncbi:ADP-ribosylglycohydrolase [Salmonella enterica subsp. enterica]|uniref:ADP-ribosylglycohydrolase n=1 Tax=Salmonella enterica I TaxID=59201 RepID=A0A3S4HTN5_SALET|nr:ADP-ribosylglycohydrolase [Salmonella enterica subsp. enterica]